MGICKARTAAVLDKAGGDGLLAIVTADTSGLSLCSSGRTLQMMMRMLLLHGSRFIQLVRRAACAAHDRGARRLIEAPFGVVDGARHRVGFSAL